MLSPRGISIDENAQGRRYTRVFPGQVGTDDLPAHAGVGRPENHIRTQVEDVRVDGGEDQGSRPVEAIFSGAQHDGRNILGLTRDPVELCDLAPVNDVRIDGVGCNVAVFLDTYGIPIAKADLSKVAAAGDAGAAAFLLPSIHPVRKLIVGDDVIELRSGLVVPRTPGGTMVDADGDALVAGQGDDLGVFRIDPYGVIVVAARGSLDGSKAVARIGRPVGRGIGDKDRVAISRMDADACKVVAPSVHPLFRVHPLPTIA